MSDPFLLHIFNPTKNVSPFDVNMGYEARFDGVIPYSNVTLDEIHDLTQDTIFSRGPAGVRRTGIFIGGREFGLAIDMMDRARAAMVPPFEVSVFADPSGAITTASAVLACIERCLQHCSRAGLAGKKLFIFGGTGPVGICSAVLAASRGAETYIVSHRGMDVAEGVVREYNRRHGTDIKAASSQCDADLAVVLEQAQIIIGAAKSGIRVVTGAQLQQAVNLCVVADVNAVPPSGIEGVGVNDLGAPVAAAGRGAFAVGALAIGALKYKVHRRIFEIMKQSEKPVYADHALAFELARELATDLNLDD